MSIREELKTAITNHVKIRTEEVPSDSALNDYADNLIAFFNLLIEADRKSNECQNLRNPDIAN